MTVVLDTWAVLRYLEDAGAAAEAVSDLVGQEKPLMSWINLGEVHYVLRRLHGEDVATETVRDLRDVIHARLPPTSRLSSTPPTSKPTTRWPTPTRSLRLTVAFDATLWTADPELFLDGASWRWRDLRFQLQAR